MRKQFLLLLIGILVVTTSCKALQTIPARENLNPPNTQVPPAPSISITPEIRPSATPVPSATVTPIKQPDVPLTAEGPWLVFSKIDEKSSGDAYIVCNPDGIGCHNFDWTISSPPYRAPDGLVAGISKSNDIDLNLMIYQLPDGKQLQQIPLLSDSVKDQLDRIRWTAKTATADLYLFRSNSYAWSPDGHFLAYLAALENINSDLYLYDRDKNSSERITSEEEPVAILGWSPDNSQLIYYTVNYFPQLYSGGGVSIKSVYAIEVATKTIRKLYDFPQDMENEMARFTENICWISDESFLAFTYTADGYSKNMREINSRTGEIKSIFPGIFSKWGMAPDLQKLYLEVSHIMVQNLDLGREPGIYTVDRNTGKPKMFLAGEWSMTYIPNTQTILAYSRTTTGYDIRRITPDGTRKSRLTFAYPSNNGRWVIANTIDGFIGLFDPNENKIIDFSENGGRFNWLGNTDAFYYESSGNLYLYAKENNWERVKIASYPDYHWSYVIP